MSDQSPRRLSDEQEQQARYWLQILFRQSANALHGRHVSSNALTDAAQALGGLLGVPTSLDFAAPTSDEQAGEQGG